MRKEEIAVNLEFWIDLLEEPGRNDLETGFSHNPLTEKEILKRYKEECEFIRSAMITVLRKIKEK